MISVPFSAFSPVNDSGEADQPAKKRSRRGWGAIELFFYFHISFISWVSCAVVISAVNEKRIRAVPFRNRGRTDRGDNRSLCVATLRLC